MDEMREPSSLPPGITTRDIEEAQGMEKKDTTIRITKAARDKLLAAKAQLEIDTAKRQSFSDTIIYLLLVTGEVERQGKAKARPRYSS